MSLKITVSAENVGKLKNKSLSFVARIVYFAYCILM